ncbi:hypothetical protein BKA70DRAFT_1165193 [Coprinopsis sp. MPI-PUGE-AT-0042]|nr:hypothetical protein BKA70DRAFT_1165193 [Coprinopsis sp. MPI-PUGE-AT-0042]
MPVYPLPLNQTVNLHQVVYGPVHLVFHAPGIDLHSKGRNDNSNINLMNQQGDIILHISFRRAQNAIVFNDRKYNGAWGTEQRIPFKDVFADGVPAKIEILGRGDWEIVLGEDGPRFTFPQRLPNNGLAAVAYKVKDGEGPPLFIGQLLCEVQDDY